MRSKNFRLWGVCALLASCGNEVKKEYDAQYERVSSPSLIYGSDDRREYYQVTPELKKMSDSTVALVKANDLRLTSGGFFQLPNTSFQSVQGVCSSEPFAAQPVAAFCSGSLVTKDIVLTAGHCIRSLSDCSSTRFVFSYAVKSAGAMPRQVSSNDVYSCKEILHSEVANAGADFAIIRLDRSVVGRSPLPLRRSGSVSPGDTLVVIGHPVGLPTKVAGGANVRSVQNTHFVANLDTYGGNSGSAVFNASTGVIEGILVRGDTDFIFQGGCSVSNRCADSSCRGEDVTRMDKVLTKFPVKELPGSSDPIVPPEQPEERFTVEANLAIPDNNQIGVVSSLMVNSVPAGRVVQVTLSLTHTYRGDLVVTLVAPDGREVILHNRTGASADHLIGTFGDSLSSANSLSRLSDTSVSGVWKIKVSDRARLDVGRLGRWGLIFKK
jgi:subtilisin-like proprotein convertase family protein/V8-like Glu-specific endopeptidase